MQRNILVIGSLNMDISIQMQRLPLPGETVSAHRSFLEPGGKGANQACAAGKLGANVAMLGCVGADDYGKQLLKSLYAAGVDCSLVARTERAETGTAYIYVDAQGGNSIVVISGANALCDTSYIAGMDNAICRADYILLQLEIPLDAALYAIRRAKALGKTVILNPAPAPEALPEDTLALVDFITPNETELSVLSGLPVTDVASAGRAAQALCQKGARHVLVTLGKTGALLADQSGSRLFQGYSARAIDTTAAGDCFNGAFVAALSECGTAEAAIRFANAAASLSVSRRGAQGSMPTRAEVDSMLAR